MMAAKLLAMNVCERLVVWIVGFLVQLTQSVRYQTAVSFLDLFLLALLRVLFCLQFCSPSIRTTAKVMILSTLLITYSDDSAIKDLSDNSDTTYFQEVERFTTWCEENHLDLNVGKTKEMAIDFRKSSAVVPDLFINGVKVERMTEYKYLGTVFDSKLKFNANSDFINKKCQSRLYCLWKLRSFHVNRLIFP